MGVGVDLKSSFRHVHVLHSDGTLAAKAAFGPMHGLFRSSFIPMDTLCQVASHVPWVVHVFAVDTAPDDYRK